MTGKLKQGRPTRSLFDSARGSFWACNLRYISRKTLSEVEREVNPTKIKKRDGGGYIQPNAYNKYANGSKVPANPLKEINSPVNLAEKKYPTSEEAYNSIFWVVLNEFDQNIDINKYQSLITPRLKIRLRLIGIDLDKVKELTFSDDELAKMVLMHNIDILGLLLLQIIRFKETINPQHVLYIRKWLLHSSRNYLPFKDCHSLLFNLIEERIHDIGVLQGYRGLDISKSEVEASSDANYAALLSGKMVIFKHSL